MLFFLVRVIDSSNRFYLAKDSPPLGVGQGGRSWSESGGVCPLLPILLTEDDWVGACADTPLLEALPCRLATRLA